METLRKRVVQVGELKYIRIYTYSFETRSKLNKSKMQHHDSLFYSVCFVKKSVYIKASTKIFLVDQRNVETILTVLLVYSMGSLLKCWTLVSLLLVTNIRSDAKKCIVNTMLSGHFNNLEVYTWKMKQIVNRILKRYSIYVKDSQ